MLGDGLVDTDICVLHQLTLALLRRPELADEVLGGAFRVLALLDEHLAAEPRKLVGVELAVPEELLRPLHEVALGVVAQREPGVYGDCVATGVDLERHEQLLSELRLALLDLADLGRIPTVLDDSFSLRLDVHTYFLSR